MKLDSLKLRNFRNYTKEKINFSPHVNFIIGPNGSGKTNIVEAIYMLAITKTYKSMKEEHLVKRDEDHFLIKGVVERGTEKQSLSLYYDMTNKLAMINDDKVPKLSDYIGNLNVILFSPEDLNLIKGQPGGRRKFINLEIGQINRAYLKLMHEYNKVLKNRNEYLKNKKTIDGLYIETLNEQLAELGGQVYKYRFKFIDDINKELESIFKSFHGKGSLVMKYEANTLITEFNDESKDILLEKLNSSINQDSLRGGTTYGPHRDDFSLFLDDENIKLSASQGQIRLATLALKCAEINLFKVATGEDPIILLDDLFSELDKVKVKNILKFIKDDSQIIITTTDLDGINQRLLKKSKIFEIENKRGNVKIKTEEMRN